MTVTKKGFKELQAKLRRVVPVAKQKFDRVNKENADHVAQVARVLIPQASGRARSLIRTFAWPEGGYAIDFGPLSRILEGGTEERFTKSGKGTGRGPALPFVNPALGATRAKRQARARKAIREAWRDG